MDTVNRQEANFTAAIMRVRAEAMLAKASAWEMIEEMLYFKEIARMYLDMDDDIVFSENESDLEYLVSKQNNLFETMHDIIIDAHTTLSDIRDVQNELDQILGERSDIKDRYSYLEELADGLDKIF